ncbi:nudC domain-containing protein 1 [Ochlerotatus camptorhynchus]|uniref:nudC domain-containing protein 1 n=1 Tax=Ochlerotatus camptorhynchus TaxID=644619 RepID=UPI0031D7F029
MKTLELRPDRSLLKPNFDGYKLSLEPIPILRTDLTGPSQPNRIRPSESQYSHLHAQVFGLQNLLVRDSWAPGNCYFVDQNRRVCWVQYNDITGQLMPVVEVFSMDMEESEEVYNSSLVFLSEKYALVADGRKVLHLVDTGDRRKGGEWNVKFTCTAPEWPGCCILVDGRFEIINGERQIHAIGAQVVQEDGSFKTGLYWVKAVQKDSNQPWVFHSSQVLKGRGYPYYCALEPKSKGLVIASDKPFKFVTNLDEAPMEQDAIPDENSCPAKVLFSWSQTTEDIIIKIPKSDEVEYQVSNHNLKLRALSGETTIIDGESWFAGIDAELTSWTNDSDEIQITLYKANPGIMWPLLFPGAPEETGNRVEHDMPPASNLTSQLEECDFGVAGDETEYTIERLDDTSMETTHKVFLGGNVPLFRVMLRPGFPDALALRYDVDACLWLQQSGEDWSLRHEGTLHAFGYVQASKQQRKFMSCSPDVNYAVICEAQRHVFIYKGSYNSAGGLRNRNGPQVSIGQQKLVSLEGSSEILGICCENDYTILLLETEILVLQLCIEE